MTHDANDAVKLIRAFAAKVGQGHSTITFDPDTDQWQILFGMRIRGRLYSWNYTLPSKSLACMRYADVTGENLGETALRQTADAAKD